MFFSRVVGCSIVLAFCLPPAYAADGDPSDWGRAEWSATGAHAWDNVAGVALEGLVMEGGAAERFVETIDLKDGRSRIIRGSGTTLAWTGYDSLTWNARNGIVNQVDLPSLVTDARSRAFVDRAGWHGNVGYRIGKFEDRGDSAVVHYLPTGGSEVRVTFDSMTHTVSQAVIETDDGPFTITYGDWRDVEGIKLPFRRVEANNVGEVMSFEVQRARLLSAVPEDSLSRPTRSPQGRLLSGTPSQVRFEYAGSHIRVPVQFNGYDATVIFDTGAANYVSPEAARRFGMDVTGGLSLSGVGESSTTGGFALAKSVTLGSAELRDEAIMVGPIPWPVPPGKEQSTAVGSVGYEFLAEFRTTIDYPEQTITLTSYDSVETPPVVATTIPFYSDGHSIYIEAEVEGNLGLFRLDTGDGGTVTLFPDFVKAHGLDTGGKSEAAGGGLGGGVTVSRVTLARFALAGAEFQNLPALLSRNTAGSFASRTLAGNLGGGVLRCFRLTFDYPGRTITFEYDAERLGDCAVLRK